MIKEDFFDLVDGATHQFSARKYEPKGVRLEHYNDPFGAYWKIWIVGPGSIDPHLVMATDIWPIKGKYTSEKRAQAAFLKYNRWFKEWQHEDS